MNLGETQTLSCQEAGVLAACDLTVLPRVAVSSPESGSFSSLLFATK